MKTLLTTFVLATTLLAACNAPEPVETPAVEPTDNTYEATHNDMDSGLLGSEQTVNDDGSITLSIYWEGELVGTIEKEKPADGYEVLLFDQTDENAYIAVNPTGLGGYILYGHAFEVYEYDFATQAFEVLPVTGVDDISPDGNLVAYWTTWEGPAGEFWGPAVYDLSQGVNVSNYQVYEEFDEGGHATFSPSGKNLAFELADKDDTENGEEHSLFLGSTVGGEFKEVDRQVNDYFSMDWELNEKLKSFELANQ